MNSYKDMFDLDSIELKVVRIFLLAFVLLLAFQALQFANTRKIDKKHSELVMAKNQSLESMQDLLIQSSTIQRKLLNLALTEDEAEIAELEKIIAQAEVSNDKSLGILEATGFGINPNGRSEMKRLKEASAMYREIYVAYMAMIRRGNREAALEFRNTGLRPAYESYQDMQQQMLVSFTDDLVRQSHRVSNYAVTSGWILFFLGLAPFIYAIAKLIYLSVFLRFKTGRIFTHQEEIDKGRD